MALQNNMNAHVFHIGLDHPAQYEIKIQGRVDHLTLLDWFQGDVQCSNAAADAGETGAARVITILVGTVRDQAALHGLLKRIRDLGLVLLYVDCLSARSDGAEKESSHVSGGKDE